MVSASQPPLSYFGAKKRGQGRGDGVYYTQLRNRKGARHMEWIERLNRAVEYLEEHLEEPDPREAAKIACCSPYHFQRMFSYLAGIPLGEYIRRRRMTRGGADWGRGGEIRLQLAHRLQQGLSGCPRPAALGGQNAGSGAEKLSAPALRHHGTRSGKNGISD